MSEFEKLNKLSSPPAAALAGTMRLFANAAGALSLINESGVVAPAGSLPLSSIAANTSAVSGTVYLCDTSGGAFNITLPAPTVGAVVMIKDKTGSFSTNNLTLLQNASERIEGLAASKLLQTNWGAFSLFSDGTDWYFGAN